MLGDIFKRFVGQNCRIKFTLTWDLPIRVLSTCDNLIQRHTVRENVHLIVEYYNGEIHLAHIIYCQFTHLGIYSCLTSC